MSHERASGRAIIWLTILAALLLQVMPLPPAVAAARPDWVLLTVTYWVLALPHRFNILSACLVGVVLDILVGGTLGVRGLALSITAYLVALQYQKLRHFALFQQFLVIGSLSLLLHLLIYWAEYLSNPAITIDWVYLQPVLITPLLWPWVFWLLRRIRRQFKIR
ncbi:rod shape-determining protein MreD [Ferrimonas balearica]|uniref:rod shape-determining protein MreD n=1 Tax=Ferrimonas balearica TaxID=44012 RepID=UPI001C9A2A53|nr:rod shape-determining protein MreD [Ferrimonas balearica]MBY5922494.1 rod shape-determining protein MreD [Ferrimonas balearica]MBY5995478.1 rod shape-determining protein MreD [Ferrimonas balearica]